MREGLCYAVVQPPTLDYAERLRAAQAAARAEGRGIHDPRSPLLETPAHFRHRVR